MLEKTKRNVLGRGLASLITPAHEDTASKPLNMHPDFMICPIGKISVNPDQPRKVFSLTELEELSESIKEKGFIQPIVVRSLDGSSNYQVIVGERRLKAASMAGLQNVPVIVKDTTEKESFLLALIENVQREDLNPLEEAEAYRKLVQDFGMTQEMVATEVGKDRATVANLLRLLRLPQSVKKDVVEGRLSMGHARAILMADDPSVQLHFRDIILAQGLSVREAENLIGARRDSKSKKKGAKGSAKLSPQLNNIIEGLKRLLATQVRLKGNEKKGKIEIDYYSSEDLDRIINTIRGRY